MSSLRAAATAGAHNQTVSRPAADGTKIAATDSVLQSSGRPDFTGKAVEKRSVECSQSAERSDLTQIRYPRAENSNLDSFYG